MPLADLTHHPHMGFQPAASQERADPLPHPASPCPNACTHGANPRAPHASQATGGGHLFDSWDPPDRPHGGSDRIFGARLSCETKHTMQNLGVCRYGNNQQTCQNSKIHQSSRTAKSAFFSAGPRWDFSVTRGVSRAQNKLWGPLLWQPMYPTLSYNMSKCSD